jgi:hypothetical protein
MTGVTKLPHCWSPEQELSWKGMTVGLDLSDHCTSLCVVSSEGEVVEEGRLRTTLEHRSVASCLRPRFLIRSPLHEVVQHVEVARRSS